MGTIFWALLCDSQNYVNLMLLTALSNCIGFSLLMISHVIFIIFCEVGSLSFGKEMECGIFSHELHLGLILFLRFSYPLILSLAFCSFK